MMTLKAYKERTGEFRANLPEDSISRLFLSWIGQRGLASNCIIARWLKCCMEEAEQTSPFLRHIQSEEYCVQQPQGWGYNKDILDAAD